MRDRPSTEPLAAIVALLRPRTVLSKFVSGTGRWAVRYPAHGRPSFCLVTRGQCWLAVDGAEPLALAVGDFVLLPATPAFRLASEPEQLQHAVPPPPQRHPTDDRHHGAADGEPSLTLLGGFFEVDPGNAPLLLELLPAVVHIRAGDGGPRRLAWLAQAIGDEASAALPGGDAILSRLVEVMLIEALRWRPEGLAAPARGLMAGLADTRLSAALRRMHERVAERWTVESLAACAGLSRAAFAARFTQVMGMPPMDYLMRWRIAMAKDLLWHDGLSLGEVAHAVGYQSASAFSVAFRRTVGEPPGVFSRRRHAPPQGVSDEP